MKVTAKIKEIKKDRKSKIAIVSIEVTYQGESWHKAIKISPSKTITKNDFIKKVREAVLEDLELDKTLTILDDILDTEFTLLEQ